MLISKALGLVRVLNEGSSCHPHVYPWKQPSGLFTELQSIAALWLVGYSFAVPLKLGGWVGLGGSVKYLRHQSSIRRGGRESNSRPSSRESNALATRLWNHLKSTDLPRSHISIKQGRRTCKSGGVGSHTGGAGSHSGGGESDSRQNPAQYNPC